MAVVEHLPRQFRLCGTHLRKYHQMGLPMIPRTSFGTVQRKRQAGREASRCSHKMSVSVATDVTHGRQYVPDLAYYFAVSAAYLHLVAGAGLEPAASGL